jgi:hypothetical protein
MAEVFSLLLAGGALLVFCLAAPGFRRTAGFRAAPVPVRTESPRAVRTRARLGAAGETAVARADGGHLLGRHDDRRCPR